ncbi:MAG: hypothetical protein JSV86_13845 [Gemmatimonadota bacterium]|nr:MAG: hypothetical protein JSV86_13845 [Gemmatimonadota bacterium]
MRKSSEPAFSLDVDGKIYDLSEAEFKGVLFEVLSTLVFEKAVDRVSYVLEAAEGELTGSGGKNFDPLSVSLYRHLKVERCSGPSYAELGGETQSFRLHAIVDGLVAAAFFLKGGDHVPHMIVGRPDRAVLIVLDRGARAQLNCGDPRLLRKLTRSIPGEPRS